MVSGGSAPPWLLAFCPCTTRDTRHRRQQGSRFPNHRYFVPVYCRETLKHVTCYASSWLGCSLIPAGLPPVRRYFLLNKLSPNTYLTKAVCRGVKSAFSDTGDALETLEMGGNFFLATFNANGFCSCLYTS